MTTDSGGTGNDRWCRILAINDWLLDNRDLVPAAVAAAGILFVCWVTA